MQPRTVAISCLNNGEVQFTFARVSPEGRGKIMTYVYSAGPQANSWFRRVITALGRARWICTTVRFTPEGTDYWYTMLPQSILPCEYKLRVSVYPRP